MLGDTNVGRAFSALDEGALIGSKGRTPWETEPYRLWSLLDMQRFHAMTFAAVLSNLIHAEGKIGVESVVRDEYVPADPAVGVIVTEAIDAVGKACEQIPVSRSLMKQIQRCRANVALSNNYERLVTMSQIQELRFNIANEINEHLFLFVPDTRKSWYREDDAELFGEAVGLAFPDSTFEIAEAGRCFAVARWTACVFHLMRALELALHEWCGQLGVQLAMSVTEANWQDILNAADKKLKAVEQQPKTAQRAKDLEYFGGTSAHFRAVKDTWRNHVSHAKHTYNEQQSLIILQHVGEFMKMLASSPSASAAP